ncbi:MAG TPA: site-2 protease family protein [Tepidiformaceae bacterium]|jgi:Zn-dependent protease|nr:site-2 protease family protein [Tepidiformaceae bacterium]
MLLYLRQFSDNPPALFAYIAAMVVAYVTGIAFHEFCHAWAAYQLGDDTAARMGRLTLNPIKHLDPLGSILLVLVGFGWGKPTPVNPYRLRNGVKRGNMLVAAAGPASNFFFAALAALPFKLGWITTIASFDQIGSASRGEIFGLFLLFVVYINVLLGVFNLIPINPLDGFKVVAGMLPGQMSREFNKLAAWGPGILMALFAISFILPQYNVLGWIIGGMGDRVLNIIT